MEKTRLKMTGLAGTTLGFYSRTPTPRARPLHESALQCALASRSQRHTTDVSSLLYSLSMSQSTSFDVEEGGRASRLRATAQGFSTGAAGVTGVSYRNRPPCSLSPEAGSKDNKFGYTPPPNSPSRRTPLCAKGAFPFFDLSTAVCSIDDNDEWRIREGKFSSSSSGRSSSCPPSIRIASKV